MSLFGLGSGLKATISVNPSENGLTLDHIPCWKVRRNPFASVQLSSPSLSNSISSNHSHSFNGSSDERISRVGSPVSDNLSQQNVYVFREGDDISGEVGLSIQPGKKAEHLGELLM